MVEVSEERFEELVSTAIDGLPESILAGINNVAITTANFPDQAQRQKAGMPAHADCRHGWLLFGLYEGIPKTKRGNNYSLVLPDKITIFKRPIEQVSADEEELLANVRNTLWHEIAHHFGLDHSHIQKLEEGAGL